MLTYMTREEAIKVLRLEKIEISGDAVGLCRFFEAIDMAVKALREQIERKVHFIELDYIEHSEKTRPNGYRYVGKVSCVACGASVISSGFHDSAESAYEAAAQRWNRRADNAVD